MAVQSWIHHWGQGAGAKALKVVAALLAFLALACLYDLLCYESYSSEEAMETAQLARNVAQGKGFTTDSIRPLALYLLASAAEPGQSSKVLAQPVPDLSNAPVYPLLLAGLMKAAPFNFGASQLWFYQPEEWISIFNQALFFGTVLLLFFLARRLFDAKVAWLAAALFAGTRLFWKFSVSGLSTIWLMLIFLIIVWLMVALERRNRDKPAGFDFRSLLMALFIGLLVGVGGLTRYAFAWLIVPVIIFVCLSLKQGQGKLCLIVGLSFLIVMAPWVVRNIKVSGHCFGTSGYTLAQDTPPFPRDSLERSTDPRGGLTRVAPADLVDKFMANARDICGNELPNLGGNWITAFFLAGLLLPFRNPLLTHLRWFLMGSLILFFAVQALGRTHISGDAPAINTENLLVLLTPLIFIYGAALFHTLLDQLDLPPTDARSTAVSVFVAVLCAPFLFGLLSPRDAEASLAYSPLHVQQTAHLLEPNELMTSDIPSGVAWYGGRACVWLPLDDQHEFFKVNALKPVRGLFLTQITADKPFLSQMETDEMGWGHFYLECLEKGEVPTGFPLRKAPAPRGLLPDQLFLSDKVRWQDSKSPH